MRRWEWIAGLAVLIVLAVAFVREPGTLPETSLFGAEMPLAAELDPLVPPYGLHVLTGTVTTQAGAPAEDVLVSLLAMRSDTEEGLALAHAYTDAAGRFRVERLHAGAFQVALVHPSAPPRSFPFELTGDQDVRWELAQPLRPVRPLPPLGLTRLTGRILLPGTLAGEPREGFELWLVPTEDTPLLAAASERRVSTDAEGRFAVESLVTAPYELRALPPWARGGTWPVLGRAPLSEGESTELLLDVGAVEGELREPSGRPLVGAIVSVSSLDQKDPAGELPLWPPALTDERGRYSVSLLPPGRYRVHNRAGAASTDLEARVESGRNTQLEPLVLAPRPEVPGAGG